MIELPFPVVLASRSKTRRQILGRLLKDFEVLPSSVDESSFDDPDPASLSVELARAKAREVAALRPESIVIAADTVVVCGGELIGKPVDRADALRILGKLTAHPHSVITGLCVRSPDRRERSTVAEARLRMRAMSAAEISDYVDSPGAMDRAGVYGLQPNDPNVERIDGSATAVMGLPVDELCRLLAEFYPSAFDH